jgi:hypothetical protein
MRFIHIATQLALASIPWVSGTAGAQVVIGGPGLQQGDPTLDPLPLCDGHIIPTGSPVSQSCAGDPPNLLGALPVGYSWANATPDWHKDRRPAVIIQMGSHGWAPNPRGTPPFWWIDNDHDSETLMPDQWVDVKRPNDNFTLDDIETFGDSEHPQSNGIPDQFDVLIRRIKLFGFHGFRRFIFHLPAGVLGVRQVGVSPPDGNGNTYPIYGGSTQSMNQFLGMPQWKRDYFLSPNGAWMQFVQEYATNTPDLEPDKYSIEVYIGGGFDSDDCYGIGTLSTTLNPDGSSNPQCSVIQAVRSGRNSTFQRLLVRAFRSYA